jgi:hypothetical protein
MEEITRFERFINPPAQSPRVTPPPIPPEAMADVARANRIAQGVAAEAFGQSPRNALTGRPMLVVAIALTALVTGGLGYFEESGFGDPKYSSRGFERSDPAIC